MWGALKCKAPGMQSIWVVAAQPHMWLVKGSFPCNVKQIYLLRPPQHSVCSCTHDLGMQQDWEKYATGALQQPATTPTTGYFNPCQ